MSDENMPAGPELDRLVAERVMGWPVCERGGWRDPCIHHVTWGAERHVAYGSDHRTWSPSINIAHAWQVVEKLAPLVGDFKSGDGFVHLIYADSADHSQGEGCNPARTVENSDEDDTDHERWSCHLHIGMIGADGGCPEHWDHGMKLCARGATAAEAICRAALLTAPASPKGKT